MTTPAETPLITCQDIDQGFRLVDCTDKAGRLHTVCIYDIPWRESARIRAALPSLGADAPSHILLYSLTHQRSKRIGSDEDADTLLTKLTPESLAALELVALAFFLGDRDAKKLQAAAMATLASLLPNPSAQMMPTEPTSAQKADSSPTDAPGTTSEASAS